MRLVATAFAGMVPKLADRLLSDSQASYAANLKVVSGNLRSFRDLEQVHTIPAAPGQVFYRAKKLYYRGLDTFEWWTSDSSDADVLLNPLASEAFNRYYETRPGVAPQVNTLARLAAGLPGQNLGVPGPTTAPTVTSTGGSGTTTETRGYTYVRVTIWGEESMPAPAGIASGKPDGTWTVSGLGGTFPNGQFIDVYRAGTGGETAGNFYRVGRIAMGTASFVDTMAADLVPLQPELKSQFNEVPPGDLLGLVLHSSGAMVGFSGRSVCFTLPYLPHAWPSETRYTLKDEVVGLAAVSNAIIAMTTGSPVILAGNDPTLISLITIADIEPCLSKRSIVVVANRAVYASPNGLIGIGTGGIDRPTMPIMTNEEWAAYSPRTMFAQQYGPWYIAFYSESQGISVACYPMAEPSLAILDRYDEVTGIETDTRSGDIHLIISNDIKKFDALNSRRFAATWRSKRYLTPKPINLGAFQVKALPTPAATADQILQQQQADAYNAARLAAGPLSALGLDLLGAGITMEAPPLPDPSIAPAPINSLAGGPLYEAGELLSVQTIRFTLIGDNKVRYSRLVTDGKVHKLPSGYKASEWFVELSGQREIEMFVAAETGKECAEE